MTGEPQNTSRSEREMEALADYFQSTSLADMESSEVPVEPSSYPMVSRSIRMEQATMSEIRKVAKRRGVPVTQLMRQWIRQGLEQAKAEEARSSTPTPAEVPEPASRNITGVGATVRYTSLSVHSRTYTDRLIQHHHEADSESVAGRRIELKVLQERATRAKRERSS